MRRRVVSPPHLLTLIGCPLGYMLSALFIDSGILEGMAAEMISGLLPPAIGVIVGLTAHHLYKQ